MSLFDFRCVCVVEREPLTPQRIETVTRRLWSHGLQYSDAPTNSPTWEMQLDAPGRCYTGESFRSVPLREASRLVAQAGQGVLILHQRDIALELHFGASLLAGMTTSLNGDRYESVELRLSRSSRFPSETTLTADATPLDPVQQVAALYAHWCQTLADEIAAPVAVGYEPDGLDSAGAHLGEVYSAAATLLGMSDWSTWQPPHWLLMWYLSPRLAPLAVPMALLAHPGQVVERTAKGGLWGLMAQWEQFSPETRAMYAETQAGQAYEANVISALAQGQKEQSDRNLAQAMAHYERALELARSRGYTIGEQFSAQSVTRLMELAASLKMSDEIIANHEKLREKYRAALGKS